MAKGLSATIWLLALLAALIAFSRRRIDLRLPTLLIAPFLVLGASSYGGEAIYRVYLFTIPAAAVLISWLLFAERRSFRIVRAGAALAVCLGITAAFVVPYFGREHLNRTSIEELALYDYVATATEPGSVVVYFSLNYPSRSTANYGDHIKGPLDIALLEVPNTPYRTFTPDDATGLAYSLFNFGTAPIYLIASESQREAIDTYGLVTPSTFDTLVQQFDASGSYRVVFANTAGKVFQVLRPGIELPAT